MSQEEKMTKIITKMVNSLGGDVNQIDGVFFYKNNEGELQVIGNHHDFTKFASGVFYGAALVEMKKGKAKEVKEIKSLLCECGCERFSLIYDNHNSRFKCNECKQVYKLKGLREWKESISESEGEI